MIVHNGDMNFIIADMIVHNGDMKFIFSDMIVRIGDIKSIFADMKPLYGDMNLFITNMMRHVGHVCVALTYFAGNSPRCLAAHTAIMSQRPQHPLYCSLFSSCILPCP